MINEYSFGSVDGVAARVYLVDGGSGVTMRVSDYGARLVGLTVPGRGGQRADIVLGFDDAQSYAASSAYLGATVGRYGNRIAGGRFTLDGANIQVDCNEGGNHLHGGHQGWDRRVWDSSYDHTRVTFRTASAAGEMGFPGRCDVSATYELTGTTLRITMVAIPSETTVINMVNHSYFNLAGHASGDILGQHLRMPADFYAPVDNQLLATGELRRVEGTPFDFRQMRPIGGEDFDHNWCLRGRNGGLTEAAEAYDPVSGRRISLQTSEPGVQMYSGGKLDGKPVGKDGALYCRNAGFTLETQKFPGSPSFAHFPTATVLAGDLYRHEMSLEFGWD